MESVLGAAGPPGPGTPGDLGFAAPPVSPRRVWCEIVALICLVGAAYGQTLGFDVVWDDHYLLVSGPALHGGLTWKDLLLAPTSAIFPGMPGADRAFRPLLALSVELDQAIFGMRPAGFHLSNVLAHLAVVLLLWRLAWRLTGSRAAAFAAGALLAVHPSAVEPVSFIAARADLFVALGLGVVLLLVRGCLGAGGGWRLLGALFGFTFALGAKETAMAIPPIITWAAWAHPRWFAAIGRTPRWRQLVARVAPFWIVLVLYGVFRQAVIGRVATTPIGLEELPAQALRALVGLATYSGMTLIPRSVTGYIIVPPPTGPADPRVLFGAGVSVLLVAGLWRLRGWDPPSALALGWYAGALVPPSNLLPIYSKEIVHVAERSLYPALAGWCLLVAVGAYALCAAAWGPVARLRTFGRAAWAAVLGTFLVVTAVKATAWRNDVTLWTSAVTSEPSAAVHRMKLTTALARMGNLQSARTVVRQAQEDFPREPQFAYLAGLLADLRGDPRAASGEYERAIALGAPESIVFRQAALLAARIREWDKAGHWFDVAAARFPREAWPQVGLAWYYERQGRADLARLSHARAARLEPHASERLVFGAQLLLVEGRRGDAVRALQDALAADPSSVSAHRELAVIAEQEGRTAEAIAEWRRVVDAVPGSHRLEGLDHLRRLEPAAADRGPEGQP